MVAYCDSEFYLNDYKGLTMSATTDEIDKQLLHASRKVDRATSYRIVELESLPAFSQKQVKLAVCAQADHDYQYGDLEDVAAALGGYTIGDVSVSGKGNSGGNDLAGHYKLAKAAIDYLIPTGLLDRRRY